MGRIELLQRTAVDLDARVYRQYPVCVHFPAPAQGRAGRPLRRVCLFHPGLDHGLERFWPAGGAPLQCDRRLGVDAGPDLHRLHAAALSFPVRPAHLPDPAGPSERSQPQRFPDPPERRLLVVQPGHHRAAGHAVHRRKAGRPGRPVSGALHPGPVPAHRLDRSRFGHYRHAKCSRLSLARQHLLPHLHHALPADVHADELGRRASGRSPVAAYRRFSRNRLHVHRRCLRPVQGV